MYLASVRQNQFLDPVAASAMWLEKTVEMSPEEPPVYRYRLTALLPPLHHWPATDPWGSITGLGLHHGSRDGNGLSPQWQ